MKPSRGFWVVVASALAAHAILLLPAPLFWKSAAALVLAGLLPGWLLVALLIGRSTRAESALPTRGEYALLAVGAGYAALSLVMLLLSYIPGPLRSWHAYLAFDLLLIGLLVPAARSSREHQASSTVHDTVPLPDETSPANPRRWLWIGLALLLVTGAFFRLANLGYAEFHGDEARAVLRAAAVIQGYDDVLMLHKKGPVEILLPAAVFGLAGRINEAAARLPFALAGLAALAAAFWVGRQAAGALAGWAAAMLLALDGFWIGFARIVQYQSIVLLMSALVIGILLRLYRQPRGLASWLTLAAIFFAVGLWSHYEAVFVLPPALWLLVAIWRRAETERRAFTRACAIALAVGGGLTGLFYLPFVLHPQFAATYTYLIERRIGAGEGSTGEGGAPYNNVADFFVRATTYSSTYAIALLIALATASLVALYVRAAPRGGWVAGALLVAGLAATAWNPAWLTLAGMDLAILFFLAALGIAWTAPRVATGERSLWLWLGIPFLVELFLIDKPRTHVYIFFMPLALLAGLSVERGWRWLRARTDRAAQPVGIALAAALLLIFGLYEYWMFVHTRVEILRTWQENWPRGYWTVYDALDNRALFGFPLANGWKAVGRLYAAGEIAGPYATNEVEFWTPAWYTRGEMRCEDKAAWFFEISNPQTDPAGYKQAIDAHISRSYRPWGVVEIHDQPRLTLHRRGEASPGLRTFPLEQYAPAFDAAATPDLPLGYPVVEPPIAHPLYVNFGGLIRLEGYEIEYNPPLRAGDTLRLTLYWRAMQPIAESYKIFNQAYYGDGVMVAQQDGYPVCGARGTWLWDPGELIVDIHEIPVRPDAPDGLYPLYTGLYIEETFERLPILDANGAPVADQLHIADIRIGDEP